MSKLIPLHFSHLLDSPCPSDFDSRVFASFDNFCCPENILRVLIFTFSYSTRIISRRCRIEWVVGGECLTNGIWLSLLAFTQAPANNLTNMKRIFVGLVDEIFLINFYFVLENSTWIWGLVLNRSFVSEFLISRPGIGFFG
jgi:hypothetical protein